MKKLYYSLLSLAIMTIATSCTSNSCNDGVLIDGVAHRTENITRFENIIDIRNTPQELFEVRGQFIDQGSWLGYAPPTQVDPLAGFAGPLEIKENRYYSNSIVTLLDPSQPNATPVVEKSIFYPGSIYLKGTIGSVEFEQNIYFVDSNNAIIKITTNDKPVVVYGDIAGEYNSLEVEDGRFVANIADQGGVMVSLSNGFELAQTAEGYQAKSAEPVQTAYAVVSFFDTPKLLQELKAVEVSEILEKPEQNIAKSIRRWNGYIAKTLRDSMPKEFDHVAVKSIITLMSNWKRERGDLFHEGIVPSHAVSYFDGFWAWDSWKHAVAIVKYEPELAKNQIRTMFDYQDERGMVIDCIYVDSTENNARDTKSSLATWAVQRVFDATQDTTFVREMYPQLVKYYKWWYMDRDRDGNGICEFGSTDGTIIAAKWESGMDNAVRFDDSKIEKINDYAWSLDQESVDLNYYLNYERQGLLKLAELLGEELELEDHSEKLKTYFWDEDSKFFYDRNMPSGKLMVEVQGPEAWTPLWSETATTEQAAGVLEMIKKPNKFSTYIPFPTCARDAEGFDREGYWRGAVWLDQVYFAINGIRNYGYNEEADMYTEQIFTRPEGLTGDAPIYENYEPLEGKRAKAPFFSWSAAHYLMLYDEYKTK